MILDPKWEWKASLVYMSFLLLSRSLHSLRWCSSKASDCTHLRLRPSYFSRRAFLSYKKDHFSYPKLKSPCGCVFSTELLKMKQFLEKGEWMGLLNLIVIHLIHYFWFFRMRLVIQKGLKTLGSNWESLILEVLGHVKRLCYHPIICNKVGFYL